MIMENIGARVSAAAKGDLDAFNQLYEYSYSTVERECLRVLHNSLDAEDALQDAFLLIYEKLGSIKDPEKFLSWCRTIAHNCSVTYIANRKRKAGKDDLKPPVSDDEYAGMDTVDDETKIVSPEGEAEKNLIHDLLQEAMDSIAPQRATCLALYQQGYSYQQISEMLSIPLGTVKSNIHYAKNALKKKIREIEEKENIDIYGFTLVPLAGKVEVRMGAPEQTGSGFIQAEAPASSVKQNLWEEISSKIVKSSGAQLPLWKKIVAVAVAVVVIVGGIVFAVNHAGHQNFATHRNSTTVSQNQTGPGDRNQTQRTAVGNRANGTPALNPGGAARDNAGPNGTRQAVGVGVTATATVTARRTTAAQPQAPRETTREYFTNRVQNLRNAVQGEN